MDARHLDEPILDDGIRTVNFFNGRLLTGEDLGREQEANRLGHRRLGRAIGEGVACGFEVEIGPGSTTATPVLRIRPGVAVNRRGAVLALESLVDLVTIREPNLWPGTCLSYAQRARL